MPSSSLLPDLLTPQLPPSAMRLRVEHVDGRNVGQFEMNSQAWAAVEQAIREDWRRTRLDRALQEAGASYQESESECRWVLAHNGKRWRLVDFPALMAGLQAPAALEDGWRLVPTCNPDELEYRRPALSGFSSLMILPAAKEAGFVAYMSRVSVKNVQEPKVFELVRGTSLRQVLERASLVLGLAPRPAD